MKALFRLLPNALTLGNLAAGSTGLYFLSQGQVINASWMVLLAAVCDILDGLVARAVNAVSPIGKDLDSLADLVSFGVLPGAIAAWFINAAQGEAWMAWVVVMIVPVATAYRLARFNNDPEQSHSFKGVPAPANGLLLGTWALGIAYGHSWGLDLLVLFSSHAWWILILVLLMSFMMISSLPLMSFKPKSLKEKENIYRGFVVLAAVILILITGMVALPLTVLIYIIISLFAGDGK